MNPDMVNHPPHYTHGEIECIDAIKASMNPNEYIGYLKGNCMKYLWRLGRKGSNDHKKAQWYLNKLVNEIEEAK